MDKNSADYWFIGGLGGVLAFPAADKFGLMAGVAVIFLSLFIKQTIVEYRNKQVRKCKVNSNPCRDCEIFNDPEADYHHCFSCEKVKDDA